MKFSKPQPLKRLASLVKAEIKGDAEMPVYGINEINVAEKGDVIFVDHPKYYDKALKSNASAIIIDRKISCPKGKALLVCSDPFSAFNTLTKYFSPKRTGQKKLIASTASIGKNTIIYPHVFIGENVQIGKNCIIYPNVSIYENCTLGDYVIVHSGTVIGSDAFYYKRRKTNYSKLHSVGKVIIEDDVEIGANCTIARGVTGETVIGCGTKLDNLVHIGHDTKIGKNCLFAAQVGISGCCVIEDDVILWGQVGVPSKIRIGKGAVLLGQSAPAKNLKGGKIYLGSPCDEAIKMFRQLAALRNISSNVRPH